MGTERNKRDTKFIRLYRLSGDRRTFLPPTVTEGQETVSSAAEYLFYAIGGVKFLPLLALTVAFNFFTAQKLERTERKRGLLTLVLVLNLGALGLFKYLGFFGELLGCTGVQLSLPQLALPIGISFYTFVICGYMIDVYRGREAERNFLDFALFTTFFPAILSGPD